jgi:hypothetical protein
MTITPLSCERVGGAEKPRNTGTIAGMSDGLRRGTFHPLAKERCLAAFCIRRQSRAAREALSWPLLMRSYTDDGQLRRQPKRTSANRPITYAFSTYRSRQGRCARPRTLEPLEQRSSAGPLHIALFVTVTVLAEVGSAVVVDALSPRAHATRMFSIDFPIRGASQPRRRETPGFASCSRGMNGEPASLSNSRSVKYLDHFA